MLLELFPFLSFHVEEPAGIARLSRRALRPEGRKGKEREGKVINQPSRIQILVEVVQIIAMVRCGRFCELNVT